MNEVIKAKSSILPGRVSLKVTSFLFLIILLCLGSANLYCQDASVNIKVTTVTYNGEFSPKNAGAIWIEDSTGKFVKSVQVWASARKRYVTTWQTSSAGNTVDAVTSASLSSHQVHNVTWNCKDVNEAIVPDGNYRVRIEFTEANSTGQSTTINFTKGPASQTVTPANTTYFINMQVIYTVGATTATPTDVPTDAPTDIPSIPPTEAPTDIPTLGPTNPPLGVIGDVNSDGSVDIIDALLIAQFYVGLNPLNFNASVGDVNCSGSADIVDALVIAQYYVGLVSQFTCPSPTADASLVTLYVSTAGNDSNLGTEAAPFKTIQKGCDSLVPGKNLSIKAGTYNEKVTINVSGTAKNIITIRNYGADKVKIDGTGKTTSHVIDFGSRSFVRIVGLEISNNTVTDGCGVYVNAGKNISIENNFIHDCNIGVRIDATGFGTTASGIVVSGNALYNNAKAAFSLGGATYNSTGKTVNCHIMNNTCYRNDTTNSGQGELAIRWAENNVIKSNIFYSTSQNLLLTSSNMSNVYNTLNYNLYYTDAGTTNARFVWSGKISTSFSAYVASSSQDKSSKFGQPSFIYPATSSPDFRLQAGSPAIDAGDPAFAPYGADLGGSSRASGARVDIGAYEYQ